MKWVVVKTLENGSFVKYTCALDQWKTGWPETSSLLCWHCCHSFETKPVPFPCKYDDKSDTFHIAGNFCSWNCSKAFKRNADATHRGMDEHVFTLFYKRCTGTIKPTISAPPKFLLKSFGGTLSIEEFRAKTASEMVSFVHLPPKMILRTQLLHEQKYNEARVQKAVPKHDMNTVVNLETSGAKKNETLKLRRPKPIKTTGQSMLERTLGLLKVDG